MGVIAIVTTRLAICLREISGMKDWDEVPPVNPIPIQEFPHGFNLLGPMLDPVPNTSAGQYIINRRYVARLPLAPAATDEDQLGVGSAAIADARTYIDLITDYLGTHPRLHTDGVNVSALGELVLVNDISFFDTGPVQRNVPGGALFICVDFNIDIAMRGITARTAFNRR
jgi:hypothetical protein